MGPWVHSPLPFVLDAEEALKPGAPLVHPQGNLVGGKPLALEGRNIVHARLVLGGVAPVPLAGRRRRDCPDG